LCTNVQYQTYQNLSSMTPIETAAQKKLVNWDYYTESLFRHLEGVWFEPTNREGSNNDDYTVCSELHSVGLIACKRVPIWVNGSHKGNRVAFLYRKNLKYQDNEN